MDPITITTSAWALATLCIQIVKTIKHVIESTKATKKALERLLNQTERVRLYLGMMRGLATQLTDQKDRELILPFDAEACQKTINQLQKVVAKIEHAGTSGKLVQAIKYKQNEDDIAQIVQDMHEQENTIRMVLDFIVANSSVKTKGEIEKFTQQASAQSEARNPFKERMARAAVVDPVNTHGFEPTEGTPYTPTTWFGQVTRSEQSKEYLDARDELSDAAWQGKWDQIRASLDIGYKEHDELWANAPRMQPAEQLTKLTFWTPLHQAAYMCAPLEDVKHLLQRGALCTLRTGRADSNFSYQDLTAGEIASQLGFESLADFLCPVIRHNVPYLILGSLQEKLHELILGRLPPGIDKHQLRLPDLTVLTELEEPEMWFPIRKDGDFAVGYAFRLDGRELLVRISSIGDMEGQLFRIKEDGVSFIEEAVTFGK